MLDRGCVVIFTSENNRLGLLLATNAESSHLVLWKHACNDHDGRSDVNYTMTVLKTYGRDNETRKTNEAVRINFNTGVRLNSKAEYRQPTVPRLSILRSSNE